MTHPTIPAPEHRHRGGSTGGPGENSAECFCGVTFAGFDTHAEAVAQIEQHIADAAHTRRADQLAAGDWVAMLLDGDPWETRQNAEVLATFPYTDEVENPRVLVVAKSANVVSPAAVRLLADQPVRVLTADELDAIREQAERVQQIADLRAFADFLECNPWAPLPYKSAQADIPFEEIGAYAERVGTPVDTRLDDRTQVFHRFGGFEYRVIAWHHDGRPVEAVPVEQPVDDLGFGYSRADDDPQVVRPHSPRVPLHRGGVVDGGQLVDETPAAPAWDAPASGLTVKADLSRGPLAGTSPVVTYFSFGYGQTDPDSGQKLIDHYVTVVAPTYDECRAAMLASRYGNKWSWDYLAGHPKTIEAVSGWTEHEVIVAPGTDPAGAEAALKAAAALLVDETPPCYVANGFQAPEVIAEREAWCAASHPGRECTRPEPVSESR